MKCQPNIIYTRINDVITSNEKNLKANNNLLFKSMQLDDEAEKMEVKNNKNKHKKNSGEQNNVNKNLLKSWIKVIESSKYIIIIFMLYK